MSQPLQLHLIFHPESAAARTLATDLYTALNDDQALPGLRIPTVIAREDGTNLPPSGLDFESSERNFIVVLADDYMVVESAVPVGRQSWANFVGDIWAHSTHDPSQRFLPVQLTDAAWPLDPRLSETNFVRALGLSDQQRTQIVLRRLVVELSRFMAGEKPGNRLPLRVFISHAKADIARDPKVYEEICKHLEVTQPVKTWIDSAEIDGGSKFSAAIAEGIQDSLLLVLATKSHSARTWCRREILLAKHLGRPFIVIEALDGIELRSFPYAGNAPKMRWHPGAAPECVDLLLKENLRHVHVRAQLERWRREGDTILSVPPELTTLVRLPSPATVLYPDPPLGDEEMEELAPLKIAVETPLQRAAQSLRLDGQRIVLSSSESEDGTRFGVLPQHLDAALIEISRQLLVRGATLEYGGHLGKDSYTTELFEMVRAYAGLSGLPPAERVINDVGWPLPFKTLDVAQKAKYAMVATFRRISRPDGVEDLEPETFVEEPRYFPGDDTAIHRYAWARGMSAMREFQAGTSTPAQGQQEKGACARIVLGGKIGPPPGTTGKWYVSRIPGVVEEVLCSLRAAQPVYLLGAFGGAAALVIDLLEGRPRADFTWDFHRRAPHAEAMREIYKTRGDPWEDYDDMAAYLTQVGITGLAKMNALSPEENRELFVCRNVDRAVELILRGLQNENAGT